MGNAIEHIFTGAPLWVMLAITLALLFFSFEGGFLIGRQRERRSETARKFSVDPMVGAVLGLLAFMLAFTFGTAATNFNKRRDLVEEEAASIRSSYAMASLLSDTACAASRALLRDYVDLRLEEITTLEELGHITTRSNEIQSGLWVLAAKGEKELTGTASSWLYVQTLTDMFNMQFERIHFGSHGKITPSSWMVLYWLATLGMASMGYRSGVGGMRGHFAYIVLVITFSMVMVLICDLDRPRQSLFHVDQGAMHELQLQITDPAEYYQSENPMKETP